MSHYVTKPCGTPGCDGTVRHESDSYGKLTCVKCRGSRRRTRAEILAYEAAALGRTVEQHRAEQAAASLRRAALAALPAEERAALRAARKRARQVADLLSLGFSPAEAEEEADYLLAAH